MHPVPPPVDVVAVPVYVPSVYPDPVPETVIVLPEPPPAAVIVSVSPIA